MYSALYFISQSHTELYFAPTRVVGRKHLSLSRTLEMSRANTNNKRQFMQLLIVYFFKKNFFKKLAFAKLFVDPGFPRRGTPENVMKKKKFWVGTGGVASPAPP